MIELKKIEKSRFYETKVLKRISTLLIQAKQINIGQSGSENLGLKVYWSLSPEVVKLLHGRIYKKLKPAMKKARTSNRN
jgi:hypothetical protein